jgi:peptidoglycan/LPS O-acetylase OafA/YrhL
LVPAYWMVLCLALILLVTIETAQPLPGVGEIAAHLTVLQSPALLIDDNLALGFGLVPPVWTLSVEVGFYIVLPFIAAAWFRRPFVGLALAAAFYIIWHLIGTNAADVADFFGADLSTAAQTRIETFYASQFPSWFFAIAAGMTGAWAYVRLRDRVEPTLLERRALVATAVAAVALVVIIYLTGRDAVNDPNPLTGLFARQSVFLGLAYPAVLAVVLVGLALAPRWLQLPLANAPMRWTGDISYGIYLIHFPVIWVALEELSLSQDGSLAALAAWCALTYPLSFVYAYLSARFVERPIRRWAHQFGRRAQSVAPARPSPSPSSTR